MITGIEVFGDNKVVRSGGSNGKERSEFVKKTGKGFRKGRSIRRGVDIEEGYFGL